jgi:hypothetical protein
MKILLFFSRIALICNICFIFAEIMRYTRSLQLNPLYSTVVILGYISLLLNILLAIVALVLLVSKKSIPGAVPRWLLITNFLFLVVQVFVFLG